MDIETIKQMIITIIGIGIVLGVGIIVVDTQISPFRMCEKQNWTGIITNEINITYNCTELSNISTIEAAA